MSVGSLRAASAAGAAIATVGLVPSPGERNRNSAAAEPSRPAASRAVASAVKTPAVAEVYAARPAGSSATAAPFTRRALATTPTLSFATTVIVTGEPTFATFGSTVKRTSGRR